MKESPPTLKEMIFHPFRGGPCRLRLIAHSFLSLYSQDGVDHVQAHLDAVPGVVVVRLGQTRNAIVAVAEDLDAEAVVVLKARIAE